jgi:hypothetical protein
MTRAIEIVGAVAVVLLLTLNGAIAATGDFAATSGATFETDSGLDVQLTSDEQINSGNPFVDSQTVELKNVTFRGPNNGRLDVDQFDTGTRTNISNVNPGGGVEIVRPNAANSTELRDDVTKASVTDPTPLKSGDVDLVYSSSADSEVAFETNGNGIVAVDLSTGSSLAEGSPTGSGTAVVELPQATDQAIGLQEGPNTLFIRSVDQPRQTVSGNTSVNISFFERGTDRVFDRQSSSGTVSFQDLPKTEEFVARATADGFFSRRTLVDSIFEQDSVFLLPKGNQTDAVNVSFTIQDNSGKFGAESTLELQRALNTSDSPNGQRRYVNVAGGVLGESREFETTLDRNVRYRIVVSNGQGEQRQLGSIVPQRSRLFELQITGLDFQFNETASSAQIQTSSEVTGSGGSKTKTLTFGFADPQNETQDLELTVHERGNPSNVLTTASPSAGSFPLGTFEFSQTVSGSAANTTYVANFSYSRLGQDTDGVQPFRGSRFPVDFPLDSGWQQIFSVGLLMVLAGVFSVGNARIGALIIPGVALLLFQIGFLTGATSLLGIGIAFSVAVGYNLVQNSGAVLRP